MKFKELNNVNIIGNFLSHSLDIALPLMMTSQNFIKPADDPHDNERYKIKIKSFQSLGLDIIPQKQKYTGFELVKEYFDIETSDLGYFDKSFR